MRSAILQVLNGISLGALLFLLASGFTLTFGLMRVVNMAYGAYYLLGGYMGLTVMRASSSFELAILIGGISIVVLGFFVDRYLRDRSAAIICRRRCLPLELRSSSANSASRSGAATI